MAILEHNIELSRLLLTALDNKITIVEYNNIIDYLIRLKIFLWIRIV